MGGVSYGYERQQESYNRNPVKSGKCSSHLYALHGIASFDDGRDEPGHEHGV